VWGRVGEEGPNDHKSKPCVYIAGPIAGAVIAAIIVFVLIRSSNGLPSGSFRRKNGKTLPALAS
jgi:hypothetical protein